MVKKSTVEILDTTLRDGAQAAGVSFTLEDKIRITLLLDELGVDYIEAGWPGSNPKDEEFFKEIKKYGLSNAKIAAFGSTRRKNSIVSLDENVNAIIKADVDVAVIFGKAWTLHVLEILRTSKEENLNMIYDTIDYLRKHGIRVIFDAEHFYQGYKEDPEYALHVVRVAEEAGAHAIVLCDTNGGTLPNEVYEITRSVVNTTKKSIVGLHMHNDIGCAVANTLMGVLAGARHVQGTINGIGERTGNADLVQILPSLVYKMGYKALKNIENLKRLRDISMTVYKIIGLEPNPYQPYVGEYAFTHKAGVHVDAVLKNPRAYEHIDPSYVGNSRKFVVSELSGSANILGLLRELGINNVSKTDERIKRALSRIKELERQGYSFDKAPSSAILIVLKELGYHKDIFVRYSWRMFVDSSGLSIVIIEINDIVDRVIDIDPITALKKAVYNVIKRIYPEASTITPTTMSITNIDGKMVRATMEFSNGLYSWKTQGVAINLMDALMRALIDGYEYYIAMKNLGLYERPSIDIFRNTNISLQSNMNT
ncbi:2-isopropylmalate synthase [Ignisphaera aggregans DSM 17230]|uniref:Citramalate synthase n=1 Tax=Ignisphaera aggregans (strain DSM 17230 / JCM 13409 / AQ1.S1) TaxID=583356 RepID=E0SRA8_IGNAA|nr:2-isopropylmalate synthase [Ignisphaera aggregans DSM 17230]